jgi:MFS family permease
MGLGVRGLYIKKQWKAAALSTWVIGMLIHLPIMVSDIPNHDGLASMYFDQNMITSGRWFLSIACGLSSYYALPWLNGLLSVFFLGLVSVALTAFLEVRRPIAAGVIGGLTVSFPVLASNFAYVYTMDGYMLGLLLAVLAVLAVKRLSWGFLCGGVCLAFSLGIYQSYLPVTMMLALYGILTAAFTAKKERIHKRMTVTALHYGAMGVIGLVLYYVILQILLWIQGKELASYQGINGMDGSGGAQHSIVDTILRMYTDFITFSTFRKILVPNVIAVIAMLCLTAGAAYVLIRHIAVKKWWKSLWFYGIMIGGMLLLPLCANVILIISPDVSYHIMMRYQWVLLPILLFAFGERYGYGKYRKLMGSVLPIAAMVLIFCYGVVDNIAYSNLEKRYEKTYAYCLRLLDRMEQTEGYYQGIPVAMVGVVGDDNYPLTDITGAVTGNMVGITGDSLLYKSVNYQEFFQYYLGATVNFLPETVIAEIYYSEVYREMSSFPGEDSVKVVDGVLYVKTENSIRD